MRILIAALVLLIAAAAAPDAAAGEAQQAAQAEAVEEAPIEPYLEQPRDCPNRARQRRGGRVVMSLACDQDGAVMAADEARSSNCASRYAHRGHRRVHLQFRNCQPLFTASASFPAHV